MIKYKTFESIRLCFNRKANQGLNNQNNPENK